MLKKFNTLKILWFIVTSIHLHLFYVHE